MSTLRIDRSWVISAVVAGAAVAALSTGCSDTSPPPVTTVVGIWGEADQLDTPYVSFNEDGTLTGSDGCNRMMGDWTQDGDEISVGPVATTLMFCEGVDTSLSQIHSAQLDGQVLEVKDSTGELIASLTRGSEIPESISDRPTRPRPSWPSE